MLFRIFALTLANGGTAWGVFTLLLLLSGAFLLDFVLTLGPGYAMTIAYVGRVCYTPTRPWRVAFWNASALVQGSWLGPVFLESLRRGFHGSAFDHLSLLWWTYSSVISVWGAVGDVD
jgi:hypothetical protein